MGRVGASLEIPYPPETAFAVATRIEDLPAWLPEVVAATLLDPPLSPGSRVRLKLSAAAAGTEFVGTVRQLRSPSALVIGGSGGPLTVEVRARLRPGRRVVRRALALEIELTTSPMFGFIGREAERRINAEIPASLQRFRAILDAEAGVAPARRPDGRRGAGSGSGRRPRCSPGSTSSIRGLCSTIRSTSVRFQALGDVDEQRPPLGGVGDDAGGALEVRVGAALEVQDEPRVGLEVVDPGPRPCGWACR